MTLPKERRFAGVIAMTQERVILVREEYPTWGGSFWNIPSGMVEAHETPAEGAARELAEEAGVDVVPAQLRLVSTSSVCFGGDRVLGWNFAAAVDDGPLAVRDPDDLVQEARWFTRSDAAKLLADLPYRPLAEPICATLLGTAEAGTHWSYNAPDAGPTVSRRPNEGKLQPGEGRQLLSNDQLVEKSP
jgi:8-oxo-dGTP diphosphatase